MVDFCRTFKHQSTNQGLLLYILTVLALFTRLYFALFVLYYLHKVLNDCLYLFPVPFGLQEDLLNVEMVEVREFIGVCVYGGGRRRGKRPKQWRSKSLIARGYRWFERFRRVMVIFACKIGFGQN